MALVEIARFFDLTEAQIAASALRASGIPVLVQNEHWGQTQFTWQSAMGGFRLWAPEQDCDGARDFVKACRSSDPSVLRWWDQPSAVAYSPLILLSLFLLLTVGTLAWVIVGVRQSPTAGKLGVVVIVTGFCILYRLWAMRIIGATYSG